MGKRPERAPDIDDPQRQAAPLEIPLEKVISPLQGFVYSQATTGVFLLLAVILALSLANSRYLDFYQSINHLPLTIGLGDWHIEMSLKHWVNEGLMVLFFFVLGLEIKGEILAGELRDPHYSGLVIVMALGGMLVPALFYVSVLQVTGATEAVRGWGIPMATDTAFALGVLALLGSRAPAVATVIMSALAIVDDIGAVLVISLVYTAEVDLTALFSAAAVMLLLIMFNLAGLRRPIFYFGGGVALWWFILQSGVHATTAGILAALAVPARPYVKTGWFMRQMSRVLRRFSALDHPGRTILEQQRQYELVETAEEIARKTATPLQRWESFLDKPVSLAVVPLFAFLNAGVPLPQTGAELLPSPLIMAIAAGLVAGKSVGISLFALAGLRLGVCRLPEGLRYPHIVGIGLLAGIGFTMSLFVAALAFDDYPALMAQAKLGILGSSLIAGVLGVSFMLLTHRRTPKRANAAERER